MRFVKAYGVYILLALVLMMPMLGNGYILTLDMVPAPPYPHWLQKIVLFAILLGAGIGAHRLITTLRPTVYDERVWRYGAYFAGLFFMINPFVYSRFMAGQYLVLLGYALLPFFLRAWLLFLREPGLKRALAVSTWLVLISIASIHTVGMAALAAAGFGVLSLWQRRQDKLWRVRMLKFTGVIGGIVLLACSYWLVPALLGQGRTANAVAAFGSADLAAFATSPDGLGWLGNVLALQGFWADTKSLYITPMDVFNWWWLPVVALWLLVGLGVYKSWKAQRGVTLVFVCLIIISAILAIGTAGTLAAPMNEFLINHIPFFAGYREPQKFVALIALGYAYFAAVAVGAPAKALRRALHGYKFAPLPLLPAFALPFLLAPLMLWGFHGQLQPRQYPADWYAANDYLKATDPGAKVLFLPWHLYMWFNFAGRVIANPADKFFGNPVVMSSDPEMDGAKSYRSTPDQMELQSRILPAALAGGRDFAKNLHMLNIRYVIVAKELDYKRYGFLGTQPGFSLVQDTTNVKVYKVNQVE